MSYVVHMTSAPAITLLSVTLISTLLIIMLALETTCASLVYRYHGCNIKTPSLHCVHETKRSQLLFSLACSSLSETLFYGI